MVATGTVSEWTKTIGPLFRTKFTVGDHTGRITEEDRNRDAIDPRDLTDWLYRTMIAQSR